MNTPICDFVERYAAANPLRLHMPGHKGSPGLGMEALDITEIPGADTLYPASGIIRQSEENAAALFGSARTVYSAEGSSLCIRAMVFLARQFALETGRPLRMLAGRNAHKTFLSALALTGMEADWLFGEAESLLSCDIKPEELEAVLAETNAPAVYLTCPDYLGNLPDLRPLAEVCRRHDTLLLVDNAHGAYLKFLSPSRHPLDLGADLCCDSAHKTLPVLTGGAYLHFGKRCPAWLTDRAEQAMAMFASTSPSYLILQSLDQANALLAESWPEALRTCAGRVERLKAALSAAGWATLGSEPTKLTLLPKSRGYTGTEVAQTLERRGVFCEFADDDHIVFLFSPALPDAACAALSHALESLPPRTPIEAAPPRLTRPERVCAPREAMLSPSERLPLEDCAGRVLASPGVSCPPAVPILVCGERIDDAAMAAFRYYGIESLEVIK